MPLCIFFLWELTVAFQNDLFLSGVAHSPRNVAELLFQRSYPKHVSTCGTFGYHLGGFFFSKTLMRGLSNVLWTMTANSPRKLPLKQFQFFNCEVGTLFCNFSVPPDFTLDFPIPQLI
jgi:hypothetical protein